MEGYESALSCTNWNTWDANHLNAVMKIPDMAEVRLCLYDDKEKYLHEPMLWRNVHGSYDPTMGRRYANIARFGLHHPFGDYFDIVLRYLDFSFHMEFAGEDDQFLWKVTPAEPKANLYFFVTGLFRWNAPGALHKEADALRFQTPTGEYRITFEGEPAPDIRVNASHQGFVFSTAHPLFIRCNRVDSVEQMQSHLSQRREACLRTMIKGGGVLGDSPEAIVKGIAWNTIHDPVKNRLCTPVARTWCTANGAGFGSYVLFDWDTFFAGVLSGIQDKNLAYRQIFSILEEITPDGFVPNFGAQRASSLDRSQPPVGAYCVLKLFRQFGEASLLEQTYDRLKRWNAWWMPHRDGNGDGLLEWGSDPFPLGSDLGYESNNMQAAMYESGLDNSPMYDGVVYNTGTHTMELADVGLNSLYALDLWALSEMAGVLGLHEDAAQFRHDYDQMCLRVNALMWNETLGIYCNRFWDGTLSPVLSPTCFYPMLAGIADHRQSERMIREHLLNEDEFWGPYVIPSVSKASPAFADNDYWRGRIWGPMNFLVHEGLKRSGFYDISHRFAEKSLALFQKEWSEENHIHENYNCLTGDGDDRDNADPLYTWGALLAYTAVSEWIDAEPWAGIRLGNLSSEPGEVANYRIGNDRYRVRYQDGLTVEINDRLFLRSTMPIRVTGLRPTGEVLMPNGEWVRPTKDGLRQTGGGLSLQIVAEQAGTVEIWPGPGVSRIHAACNGIEQSMVPDAGAGCIRVRISP